MIVMDSLRIFYYVLFYLIFIHSLFFWRQNLIHRVYHICNRKNKATDESNLLISCISPDIQPPTIVGVNETSITLQWSEPPPALTGNPHRIITQYAVKILPQVGGDPQVFFVPAEIDAVCVITGLHLSTTYDIKVDVVIDTEGQGEQTYDIGSLPFNLTTASE